jgi:uncharacterized membrane protein
LRLLLLIIPGIIAALNYALVYFILLDEKEISASEAILKSKKMMYGHRKRLFYLTLRFLGLGVLSIFTLFIGLLWLIPYSYVAYSLFYEDVKNNMKSKELSLNNN